MFETTWVEVKFLDLQVADKIRRDKRVSVIERTNLRYLSELPQQVDLVTLDLSFISILTVCFHIIINSLWLMIVVEYLNTSLSKCLSSEVLGLICINQT